MINYLVTRLVNDKSIYYPVPFVIGNVEIKSRKYDFDYEEENLKKIIRIK